MIQTQTLLERATFSVGICALTEVETTLQLVGQILTSFDEGLSLREVIVATPNRTIADLLKNTDPRLIVIHEEKREGKIPALRKILERATGDILVLASADIRVGRHSIFRLVHALAGNERLGAVDSQVELVNGNVRLPDKIATFLGELHNELLEELDRDGSLAHIAGYLMALKRNLVKNLPRTINDDAYIALDVRRQGYGIKRIQNAPVWIAGPRNPVEYVAQRSRILHGHFQLIKLFGKMPTTFEFTLLTRPLKNFKVLRRVIRTFGPGLSPAILGAIFLEFVSLQLAILQLIAHRKYHPWRIIPSTKTL